MRRTCVLLLLIAVVLGAPSGPAQAAGVNDYCSFGTATSVLLVDRTTAFDGTDQDILIRTVEAFFSHQDAGERVLVVALNGAYTDLKIVFNECRPGCPETGFFGRLVSTCRSVIAREEYRTFEGRFILTLRDLLKTAESAPQSDLFRSVAETTRLARVNAYPKVRQFLFYSDLLEASSILPAREITRLPPAEALRRLSSAGVAAEFAGADVRVIGFGRSDAPGRPTLSQDVRRRVEETWTRWLQAGGAGGVQIGLR